VHTNNLIINDRTARQAIKGIAELFPHFDRESTTALIVESIDAVNARALVVAAQEEKVFGVLDLVSKEQTDDFD
jgi:hypothetical protein